MSSPYGVPAGAGSGVKFTRLSKVTAGVLGGLSLVTLALPVTRTYLTLVPGR